MKKLSVFAIFALLLVLAVPALAADYVIVNGLDLWRTPGDGTTFANFSDNPIPAGFFCPGSAPFTGRIVMKGVPIASNQPGMLADTIIQRLDNARFNKRGVATTRIQMKAMQFEGLTPVKTICGAFKAYVRLDGEQPITTMRIVRDHEKGGRAIAPISVNIKISFEPIGRRTTEVWELRQEMRFPPAPLMEWVGNRVGSSAVNGFVKVDTDSDGVPDTFLPGTSSFTAGRSAKALPGQDPLPACHASSCGTHCALPY